MALRPRFVAVVVAGLCYVIASQWLMTRTPPSAWSAVALLTPMLALATVGAWRSGRPMFSIAAAAVIVALALQAAWGGGFAPERLYLLEHVGFHVALALAFGITLRRGTTSLITRLADRVHQGLTPAMARYTRGVTIAWTIYFASIALVSIGLYLGAPFRLWATFANLVTPLALALMFVGEHLVRYRLHPEFERATMHDAIRAYTQATRPTSPQAGARRP